MLYFTGQIGAWSGSRDPFLKFGNPPISGMGETRLFRFGTNISHDKLQLRATIAVRAVVARRQTGR